VIFITKCKESLWGGGYVDEEQESCEGCETEGEESEPELDFLS